MAGNVIDFSSVPSARTPFDSNNEADFSKRAKIAVAFEANRSYPGGWTGGEIDGDGSVNNAIARLELGGTSLADIRRGPELPSIFPQFAVDSAIRVDNIAAVNDALLRTRVRARVGTSADESVLGIPVIVRTGEWDTVLKGLIVILYRHHRKLRPDVYSHALNSLLNVRGARPSDADGVALGGVVGSLLPNPFETENHVLLIETSRYLTNQLLALDLWRSHRWVDIDGLREQVDADLPAALVGSSIDTLREVLAQSMNYDNETNGMNAWMLRHLQRFLQFDFWE